MKYLKLLTVLLALASCGQNTSKTSPSVEKEPIKERKILPQLAANLEQHGGLETWQSFGSLTFNNGETKHILNLENRNEVFQKDSTFTVGFNNDQVWVLPDSSAHPRAKFYRNLYFYFFALPFVAADEGVNHEYLGQKKFNSVNYDLVKLSYADNVGDSPEDQYILYINSESKQLEMINYSVTYFDKSQGEKYNALVYTGWEVINGLLVPTGFDGFRWENDTLGDKRYEVRFSDILFKKETPDASIFTAPEGAFVPGT